MLIPGVFGLNPWKEEMDMKLPLTAFRVRAHTNRKAQERIRQKTLNRVSQALRDGTMEQEDGRLLKEWDTERVLETNAACLLLASLGLGVLHDRRWLWLTGGVAAFLLQHALQGWCPPLPVIRALGVRTAEEIGAERLALGALREAFAHENRVDESDPRLDAAGKDAVR